MYCTWTIATSEPAFLITEGKPSIKRTKVMNFSIFLHGKISGQNLLKLTTLPQTECPLAPVMNITLSLYIYIHMCIYIYIYMYV